MNENIDLKRKKELNKWKDISFNMVQLQTALIIKPDQNRFQIDKI